MSTIFVEDVPAASPQFGTEDVAKALTEVLLQPTEGALVVGIHGPWGCGKTTLLTAVDRELQARDPSGIFITFNAWKFQDREALWRALILHVLAKLGERAEDKKLVEELRQSLYRAFAVEEKGTWQLNWRALIVETVGLLLAILRLDFVGNALKASTGWFSGLFVKPKGSSGKAEDKAYFDTDRIDKMAGILERETVQRQVLQIESIEQFLEQFKTLIDRLTKDGRRVYVMIDDLDRCLPESALQIFESIKLFLDASGSRYLVALDRNVIRKGLAVRYARGGEAAMGQSLIDPDEYIEKTISLSYDVRALSGTEARSILDRFTLPVALDEAQKKLILDGIGTNPRRVKRFMNALGVQMRLEKIAGAGSVPIAKFIKREIIRYRYSGVFSLLQADSNMITRLQQIGNKYASDLRSGAESARAWRKSALLGESPLVWSLEHEEDFWRLLDMPPTLSE